MDKTFLHQIQEKVVQWRELGYPDVQKETLNILKHIKRVGFLHLPQIEALETYIFLKEVAQNQTSLDLFKSLFNDEKEMLLGLGVPKDQAFDLMGNTEAINVLLNDKFGEVKYPNQVYALTMGAGKTVLMAVMTIYDFVLSFYHPEDLRFAKNILVFAPDTTIIESLKEIKTFDYSKVLPKEYENILLNIKYHYLEDTKSSLSPIGNYNIIISNSQKIILKTTKVTDSIKQGLFANEVYLSQREVENKRLQAIRELSNLSIFVDEAHHSYGSTLEGTLKKTRQTINYLHENTPLVGVVNLTGTPYVNNKMIGDVVYHFGLNQGIEKGILKQVRFFDYSNVKSETFLEDVVEKFWEEYKEHLLEERLPKIAFYAGSIEDIQSDLRPKLEQIFINKGIPLDKIIEYHTEAEENKQDFLELDTPQSKKQFILLVGKGTEGWNCRSLVSCALYRKPKSSVFVLQSSTRCLRGIGDNSTVATIFLSNENYRILDKELQNNFSTSIKQISSQEQESVEHTLKIEKRKKVKVRKILKEILAVQNKDLQSIKISWNRYKPEKYTSYISEAGILLDEENKARYRQSNVLKELKHLKNYTFYEIVCKINQLTHIPCLSIEKLLLSNIESKEAFLKQVNQSPETLSFLIDCILENAYEYDQKEEIIEEEVELTKLFPFKINVDQGKNTLIVYKEQLEERYGKSKIGFHINPYNFASTDEKDLFKYLREALNEDEGIVDVFFTGGSTDTTHNEFYFEYFNPKEKHISRYFPDFLVETTKGRYLVIEVKSVEEKLTYERNKETYSGNIDDLFDEVFAKEIGFKEFQEANSNFEYHIIFDATLQKPQQELKKVIEHISG